MGDGKTLVVLGSTRWRRLVPRRNTKSRRESRIWTGGREGKERKRERRGHGTGNKRMVLKSWRRAALSLYRRQLERGVVI